MVHCIAVSCQWLKVLCGLAWGTLSLSTDKERGLPFIYLLNFDLMWNMVLVNIKLWWMEKISYRQYYLSGTQNKFQQFIHSMKLYSLVCHSETHYTDHASSPPNLSVGMMWTWCCSHGPEVWYWIWIVIMWGLESTCCALTNWAELHLEIVSQSSIQNVVKGIFHAICQLVNTRYMDFSNLIWWARIQRQLMYSHSLE